jgi:hypothetical protein
MAIELVVSEARNQAPVLSVKGFNAGDVYKVAVRVNTWLGRYVPGWKPYIVPARKDILTDGEYYCPVPLQYKGLCVSPLAIAAMLEAMDKAEVEYEYISTHIGYVFPEPEEVDDIVCLFDGMDLEGMTKAQLRALASEHNVRIGSKFTHKQMVESLQDHLVVIPLS